MGVLKVALIGFGGIARTHNSTYNALINEGYPVKVAAVCEKNIEQIKADIKINIGGGDGRLSDDVSIYTDVDELIEKEDFDIADICLPTFLHKDFAVKLLRAGKHVFCEKPMALTTKDCKEMLDAAEGSGKLLMIGQCLRFDVAYRYLKALIENGDFGKLRYVELYRYSVYPRWGKSFANSDRTGGCILDTHIHDIDVARYLFGDPKEVSAIYFDNEPYVQIVNSRLVYDDVAVIANCCWDESREITFEEGYRVGFENATVTFDRTKVKVYPSGKDPYSPDIVITDHFANEIRAFCDAVQSGASEVKDNSAQSSYESIKLIDALKESAKQNGKTIIF